MEGKLYEIDDVLIAWVAMNLPNRTIYKNWGDAGSRRKHMKNVFKSNKGNLLILVLCGNLDKRKPKI